MHTEVLCKIKCFKNPNDSFYYRKDYRETLWHHLGEKPEGFFFLIFFFFYYLFLAIWVFVAAAGTFSRYSKWGCSLGAVHRLLLVAASPVLKLRLCSAGSVVLAHGLSCERGNS